MKSLTHKKQHYQAIEQSFDGVYLLEQTNNSLIAGDLPKYIYATSLNPLSPKNQLLRSGDVWIIITHNLTHITGERQSIESYIKQKEVLILKDLSTEYIFEIAEFNTPSMEDTPSKNLVALGRSNPTPLIGMSKSSVLDLVKPYKRLKEKPFQPPITFFGRFENDQLIEVFGKYDIPRLKATIVANQIIVKSAPNYAESLVLYSLTSSAKKSMQATMYVTQGIYAIAYQYKDMISEPTVLGTYNEQKHFIVNFDGSYQQDTNGNLTQFKKHTPLDLTAYGFKIYSQGII